MKNQINNLGIALSFGICAAIFLSIKNKNTPKKPPRDGEIDVYVEATGERQTSAGAAGQYVLQSEYLDIPDYLKNINLKNAIGAVQ